MGHRTDLSTGAAVLTKPPAFDQGDGNQRRAPRRGQVLVHGPIPFITKARVNGLFEPGESTRPPDPIRRLTMNAIAHQGPRQRLPAWEGQAWLR